MIPYPHFDPVLVKLGPVSIRWYGLMYVLAFVAVYALAAYQIKRKRIDWTLEQILDFLTFGMIGVLVGGRLGYLLFYQFSTWVHDPFLFFQVWLGGMSFHGGLLGVILAIASYARVSGRSFWSISDLVAPWVPVGLAFGRLGNFINGELWGRVTDLPWGMIFPMAGPEIRHPSQLYEMALEGVLLGFILHQYQKQKPPASAVSGLFLLGYGIMRFGVEFMREPDRSLGLLGGYWTRGQLLSLPMMGLGLLLLWGAYRSIHSART